MVALGFVFAMVNHKKVNHFDLGKVGGLRLTADFEIEIVDQLPIKELTYKVHFLAKDRNNKLVDQKHVDLGMCFRKPTFFLVADQFRKGYKQVFISLHYGGTDSYLFGFRNRHFYTAFANNVGRIDVEVKPSRKGTWKIREGDSVIHGPWSKEVHRRKTMLYQISTITPNSKPVLHVRNEEAQ